MDYSDVDDANLESTHIRKFCDKYENYWKKSFYSSYFMTNQKRFDNLLFLCFVCLGLDCNISDWVFDDTYRYENIYNHKTMQWSGFHICSSWRAMAQHAITKHNDKLVYDKHSNPSNYNECFLCLTDYINHESWCHEQDKFTAKKQKPRTLEAEKRQRKRQEKKQKLTPQISTAETHVSIMLNSFRDEFGCSPNSYINSKRNKLSTSSIATVPHISGQNKNKLLQQFIDSRKQVEESGSASSQRAFTRSSKRPKQNCDYEDALSSPDCDRVTYPSQPSLDCDRVNRMANLRQNDVELGQSVVSKHTGDTFEGTNDDTHMGPTFAHTVKRKLVLLEDDLPSINGVQGEAKPRGKMRTPTMVSKVSKRICKGLREIETLTNGDLGDNVKEVSYRQSERLESFWDDIESPVIVAPSKSNVIQRSAERKSRLSSFLQQFPELRGTDDSSIEELQERVREAQLHRLDALTNSKNRRFITSLNDEMSRLKDMRSCVEEMISVHSRTASLLECLG